MREARDLLVEVHVSLLLVEKQRTWETDFGASIVVSWL